MAKRLGLLDIPAVARRPWGLLGLLLNIVPWGGIGSIAVGVKSRHNGLLLVGILQVLLTPLIVGWLWSLAWGLGIFLRSRPSGA